MSISDLFIKNKKDFEEILSILQNIYKLNKSLPENVFSTQFTQYKFNEFDWLTFDEFWAFIRDINNISGDSSIIVSVLDPDPINYHFKHFNFYNTVNIPTQFSVGDYREVLEFHLPDSEADAIMYNSRLLAIFPVSQKWAIWADRSYELMVLGVNSDKIDISNKLSEEWTSIEDIDAISDMVSFVFENEDRIKEFTNQLYLCYK